MTAAIAQPTEAPYRWKRGEASRLRDNRRRLTSWRAEHMKFPWRQMFKRARLRAEAKKIEFRLTEEWAVARWTGRCEVTDIEFKYDGGYATQFSPSIDRIESDAGYTPENCRFVLHAVNMLKGAGTEEAMRMIAAAIAARS